MDKDDIIRRALRFPIEPVLKRYVSHFGVSEDEAHEHELELKRYLVLSALNKGKSYVPSTPVANLWRTFLLFTLLYTEFCTNVTGAYIHHTPPEARPQPASEVARSYGDLLRDYQAVFKAEPPAHIWPATPEPIEVAALFADGEQNLAQNY